MSTESKDFDEVQQKELEKIKLGRPDADEKNLAALCFSGGGIRSATFNLGVLQGLARQGLLDKFDYLSTVSGGGYIGSWFSAWIRRESIKKATDDTGRAKEASEGLNKVIEKLKDEQEPAPIRHLRGYGNYLTPKKGALSTDTWTSVVTYIRNLLLNWLYLVPAILALLAVPRLCLYALEAIKTPSSWYLRASVGLVAACVLYIVLCLPGLPGLGKGKKRLAEVLNSGDKFLFCLAGMVISAILLTIWAKTSSVFNLAAAIPQIFKLGCVTFSKDTRTCDFDISAIYACFGVPALMLTYFLLGTLLAGLTSKVTRSSAQEWWARAGALMLKVAIGWGLAFALVIYGPEIIRAMRDNFTDGWLWGKLPVITGVVSGLLAILGGKSGSVPASEEGQQNSMRAFVLTSVVQSASLIFLLYLVAFLAAGSENTVNCLFSGESSTRQCLVTGKQLWQPLTPDILSLWLLFCGVNLAFGIVMGFLISINTFSLHNYYRNRLARAYIGASLGEKNLKGDEFTHFPYGNMIPLKDLKWQRPIHVINMALNYARGSRLDWQDRKAQTFTASPLHTGGYSLKLKTKQGVYRPTESYGGEKEGLLLDTAMAISGAAASPNMGYMMTSPTLRFLMALFNVRMGVWLGNPGNEKKCKKKNPTNAIVPIFNEALGRTDDKSSYVYLSDGGHFDNLGLYEMVLRRCRYIVVSDAASDPKYTFDCMATALRLVREDLGITIEMQGVEHLKSKVKGARTYCSVGRICYSPDRKDDGLLVFLKPNLRDNEPLDVLNYQAENPDFPQQSTADQFFGEAQFESYRMLGLHAIQAISNSANACGTLGVFYERACNHAKAQP